MYTLRAAVTFSLCELSCEKKPLPTAVQVSILHARNSSRDFATDSQATLTSSGLSSNGTSFVGLKKIATILIPARVTQCSKPVKNRKKPTFFNLFVQISGRI